MKKHRLDSPENPDIAFNVSVKARELHFDEVPDTEVRFRGNTELDSVSGTERENLPEEVRRGVTYRNICIRLRIASGFVDDEQDLWKG